jgi:hypothetical protein
MQIVNSIEKIHLLEQQLVFLLNLDGWQLEWTGEDYSHFDAMGLNLNGKKCIIEFKFRRETYIDKMLEVYKYQALLDVDIAKRYYAVIDFKGCWVFDLDSIEYTSQTINSPRQSIFEDTNKVQKEVMMLEKSSVIKRYLYNF